VTVNHFEIFGLTPSVDLDVSSLEAKYRELSLQNHPDRNPSDRVAAAQRTAAINDAVKVLKDPARRALYVLQLKGIDLERVQMPMDFLERILEQREQLEIAKAKRDVPRARGLAAQISAESEGVLAEGQAALRAGDVQKATAALAKVRYFTRFIEEVEAFEEEAA
jgi:molecular chaperone HscB